VEVLPSQLVQEEPVLKHTAALVTILYYLQLLQQAAVAEVLKELTATQVALEVRAAAEEDQIQEQAERETLAVILPLKVMQEEHHPETAQDQAAADHLRLVLDQRKTWAVTAETAQLVLIQDQALPMLAVAVVEFTRPELPEQGARVEAHPHQ
jgi:hypothetical protein